jgi:hypothetical protein
MSNPEHTLETERTLAEHPQQNSEESEQEITMIPWRAQHPLQCEFDEQGRLLSMFWEYDDMDSLSSRPPCHFQVRFPNDYEKRITLCNMISNEQHDLLGFEISTSQGEHYTFTSPRTMRQKKAIFTYTGTNFLGWIAQQKEGKLTKLWPKFANPALLGTELPTLETKDAKVETKSTINKNGQYAAIAAALLGTALLVGRLATKEKDKSSPEISGQTEVAETKRQ